MATGADTIAQYGSRFSTPTTYAFSPIGYGPTTTGVPNVSPTLPPFLGGSAGGGASGSYGSENVGGYGTAGNNALVAGIANQNPHHLGVSPTWWAVALLLIGLFLLKAVHWRDTVLEGAEERGEAGPFRETASEEVT